MDLTTTPTRSRTVRSAGFTMVDNRFLTEYVPRLHPRATALYLMLCKHADAHTRHCFPTVATLAAEVGVTPQSVHTHLRTLEREGLIRTESGRCHDAPNTYFVLPISGSKPAGDQVSSPLESRYQARLTPGIKPAGDRTTPSKQEPDNYNQQQERCGGLYHSQTTGDAAPPESTSDDPGAFRMPVGQYAGELLCRIPTDYLRWAQETLVKRGVREAIARYLAPPPPVYRAPVVEVEDAAELCDITDPFAEEDAEADQAHEARTERANVWSLQALLPVLRAEDAVAEQQQPRREKRGQAPVSTNYGTLEPVPVFRLPEWEEPEGWDVARYRQAIRALDPHVFRYYRAGRRAEVEQALHSCYARLEHLATLPPTEMRELYREYFDTVVAAVTVRAGPC